MAARRRQADGTREEERRLKRQLSDTLQPHLRSGCQEDTPRQGYDQSCADSQADAGQAAGHGVEAPIADCCQKAQL